MLSAKSGVHVLDVRFMWLVPGITFESSNIRLCERFYIGESCGVSTFELCLLGTFAGATLVGLLDVIVYSWKYECDYGTL